LHPQPPTVLLYTHDCVARFSSYTIIKFVADTVVVGRISGNDEKAYLEEVANLSLWCQNNSLILNVSKIKELIVAFRMKQQHRRSYTPLGINGTAVERVSSYRYPGEYITEELTWTQHIDIQVRKAKQRLYHLRQLRKFQVSRRILQAFYAGVVESILTGSINAWFGNSSSKDRRALQRVVRWAEHTIGTTLSTLQDLYSRCGTRACRIMKDPHHPNNKPFQLLRTGKHLRSHAT